MSVPKFLLGDHYDFPDDIFIIHTEFPHFVLNLKNDEVIWMEDLADEDAAELTEVMAKLIEEAEAFYDDQVQKYENFMN